MRNKPDPQRQDDTNRPSVPDTPALAFLRDPALFRRRRSDLQLSLLEADLEAAFQCLACRFTEGRRYQDVKGEVQAFLTHPGLIELCRTATIASTQHLQDPQRYWQDAFQQALVHLLSTVQAAFDADVDPGGRPPLLGFEPARQGKHGFTGWLYTVLLNACRSDLRRMVLEERRRVHRLDLAEMAPAEPQPSPEPDEPNPDQALSAALDTLDEDQRRVICGLRDGKSGREIAAAMGRSDAWVSKQKWSAIAALRRRLNGEADPP